LASLQLYRRKDHAPRAAPNFRRTRYRGSSFNRGLQNSTELAARQPGSTLGGFLKPAARDTLSHALGSAWKWVLLLYLECSNSNCWLQLFVVIVGVGTWDINIGVVKNEIFSG
jgi:hypothetical protein